MYPKNLYIIKLYFILIKQMIYIKLNINIMIILKYNKIYKISYFIYDMNCKILSNIKKLIYYYIDILHYL